MWTCLLCDQQFIKKNQPHSCNDKVLEDFFKGKRQETIALFWHFVKAYKQIGDVTIHPAKSMIGIAAKKRIAYIIKIGKDFIDVVFPFDRPYNDNLCFHRIAQVPGQQQFNHHFRMYHKEDVNEEVKNFMMKAYENGL